VLLGQEINKKGLLCSRLTPKDADVILTYVKQKELEIEGLELEIEDLTRPRRRRREEE